MTKTKYGCTAARNKGTCSNRALIKRTDVDAVRRHIKIDSVIDTYAVFQQQDLLMHDLHGYLWPAKGKYGLRDYEKVFHAQDGNDLNDLRGIERNRGCVVIVRPDQHIASILPVPAHAKLSKFFDFFMIAQT
jgi:phenol 2-monooxygenase